MGRLTLLLAVMVAGTALALPGLAGARGHAKRATTVTVKASEFKFVLSKKAVRHGTVVFKVTNRGKLPHDFKIAGKKTKLIAPRKSAVLRVVFKKAGRYPYLCTVPGHAAAGMKGVLRVT